MKTKKFLFSLTASFLLITSTATPVLAAKYSSSEAKSARNFQKVYQSLDTTNYTQKNLYLNAPHFETPFSAGTLADGYVQTSMDYINYYRSLFNLPSENNYAKDNEDAQIGAAALASVNASTSLRAHGLLGYKRPAYISKETWNIAESATLGNINFLESNSGATAGEIVTDLLQDKNNISGAGNTGHRALLLSARATRMGIGAAYGKDNSKFYSVENGVFADDILRPAVQNTVTYPSKNVFPYELLTDDTPWSAYFANKRISKTPTVYVTDLTTGKKYRAFGVRNYGTDYYGSGYSSAISFYPNHKLKIVNTHKYKVQIGNIYTYSFRLFRQKGSISNSAIASNKKTVKKVVKKTVKKH